MATVLLCDDALFVRKALKQILEGAGHQVIAEAANGVECINQYKLYKPELVLMDITMPDMNGIEATRQIISIDPEAKIIMVSAMGQRENIFDAIGAGAKDFIVKPFETSKIIACVNRYTE